VIYVCFCGYLSSNLFQIVTSTGFLWFSRNFGHTWFIGQYVKKTVKHILEILILKFLANFFWNFKFVLKSLEQQQRSYLGQQSSLVCFLSQFDLNLKADIVEYEERHSVWNMILFRNEHSTHIQIINILSYNITKSKQKLGLPLFCEIKFKDFQEILWPSNFQGPTGITKIISSEMWIWVKNWEDQFDGRSNSNWNNKYVKTLHGTVNI